MTSIRISAITMATNGNGHEHIDSLYWTNQTGKGWASRASMVAFVDDPTNIAFVSNGDNRVQVKSVHRSGYLPYVRTMTDGTPTDNLLYLPGGPYYKA